MKAEEPRGRWWLVISVIFFVLALVSLVLAITDPGWRGWLRVVVALCVSGSFFSAYRERRTS
ncbi:hypothetical protein [Kribbella flavida]|uniref:hypothetical protein n=1 Tax=Kribbella flavida TaxID=182640 RepID=UPI0011D28F83|nr:hypothetical protein [Kribbella flavida]